MIDETQIKLNNRVPRMRKNIIRKSTIKLHIQVLDRNWRRTLPSFGRYIRKIVACHYPGPRDLAIPEFSVVLTDNQHLQKLNAQYRGHDKVTNVLSFPIPYLYQNANGHTVSFLGDIFMGHDLIVAEARAQQKTVLDHATHLLFHGLLHLLGHDHQTTKEAEIMERLEIDILASLNIKNPYIIQSKS